MSVSLWTNFLLQQIKPEPVVQYVNVFTSQVDPLSALPPSLFTTCLIV